MALKLCKRHIDDLADSLRHKGMWHLVSQDPQVAAMRARKWLHGQALAHEFDPFVVSILEINKKAIELCGEHFMNGGQRCPLCLVNIKLKNPDAAQSWIDNCTDMMLVTCKANNLPQKLAN